MQQEAEAERSQHWLAGKLQKKNHDLKKNKLTGICAVSMARLTQVSLTLNGTHYSGMSRLISHVCSIALRTGEI